MQLKALRDQLVGGAMDVATLRANIASAVAESRAFASTTSTLGSAQSQTAQLLSMSAYQQATAEWDRKIARSYVQESQHLAYAHEIAARYGIDISAYKQERLALESERDGARRRGDKLGERKADALIAQNTVNTLTGETDAITDPAEHKKHLTELHDMQRIAQERRAALEAQIELEARRTAAEQHLSPGETAGYVAQFKQEQLADFDACSGALKSPVKSEAARAELKAEIVTGASPPARDATKPTALHPVAAALTPAAHAKMQEAATIIRATYGTSPGSVDDFSLAAPPPTSSQIELAADPGAHKRVDVPSTPAQASTNIAVTH